MILSERRFYRWVNIVIGLICLTGVFVWERTDWAQFTLNKVFDFAIEKEAENSAELRQSLSAGKDAKISDRIVFVEIDDDTYKKWGRPLLTPRDRLAQIIRAANQGGARVIVPDIILDRSDPCNPAADGQLRGVLQEMTGRRGSAKIIFPTRIGAHGEILPGVFDDLIGKNPDFYCATPLVSDSPLDNVQRFWRPYEIVSRQGKKALLWNVSFLAAALAEGKEAELSRIQTALQARRTSESLSVQLEHGAPIGLNPEDDHGYFNRIRFFLIPSDTLAGYPGGNLFENHYKADELTQASFKDKIVIIGNSSPEMGDIHPTPIGRMAGMFVLGNAINTISNGLEPQGPPLFWDFLGKALLVVFTCFLFERKLGFLYGFILFIACLFLQYYFAVMLLADKNYFINLLSALTVVNVVEFFANLIEKLSEWHEGRKNSKNKSDWFSRYFTS